VNLLKGNLQQAEETAQSAQELPPKARQGEEQEEGLIEKAKEKLTSK
jgi:hypothetical protein